jgi:hypothetical protein
MVKINLPDARDQFAPFRGSVRPDDINIPFGRGMHRGYIYQIVAHSILPNKISSLAACESFEFLDFFSLLLVLGLFASLSHSKYSSNPFIFSLFSTVRMLFISTYFLDYEM